MHPLSTEKGLPAEAAEKAKDIEMMRSGDSVCQGTRGSRGGRTPNEFRYRKAIHTMKSLILAQDER